MGRQFLTSPPPPALPAGDPTTALRAGGSKAHGGSTASSRVVGAVEARTLQWAAWAARMAGASGLPPAGRPGGAAGDGDALAEVAVALAAATPYEVSMSDMRVQLLHCSVAPAELAAVVNGAVVGLAGPPLPGQGAAPGSDLQRCLGMGLVRAVDAAAGQLYLLTDLPEEQLQGVTCLQVGRLELPLGLQQAGELAPPYQSLFCLATSATGAGVIKSRNNLLRVGLLGR